MLGAAYHKLGGKLGVHMSQLELVFMEISWCLAGLPQLLEFQIVLSQGMCSFDLYDIRVCLRLCKNVKCLPILQQTYEGPLYTVMMSLVTQTCWEHETWVSKLM